MGSELEGTAATAGSRGLSEDSAEAVASVRAEVAWASGSVSDTVGASANSPESVGRTHNGGVSERLGGGAAVLGGSAALGRS